MDNTEDRNEHFMFCKNVISAMIEAMNDLLTVDDDVVARIVQSRYRVAKSMIENGEEKIDEFLHKE